MPLDYRKVKDLYDKLNSAGATTVSLPEWAGQMNDLTGTDLYSSGFNDSVFKRASVGIDRALEAVPGLIPATTDFGRSVGSLVGNPEAGASIGAGLPRMTVNMLPYLIPGAGWLGAGARLGGAGLLSGAESYTKTGSPAAGLISGVTAAALPKVTDAAEQFALGKMGGRLVQGPVVTGLDQAEGGGINKLTTEAIKRFYPESFGQSVGSNAAGQLAAAGLMEAGTDAQGLATGEGVHNPFTTENLLNLTLGQAPFAALHLGGKIFKAKGEAAADKMQTAVDQANTLIGMKSAQDRLAERSDIEKVPVIDQPLPASDEVVLETQQRLAKLREQQQDIVNKPQPTADDAQALNDLAAQDEATPQSSSPTSVLGAEQAPDATKLDLFGTQKLNGDHARSRTIQVSDDPRNPEEFRGKTVNYSKGLYETPPAADASGVTKFSVPRDWHTVLPDLVQPDRSASSAAGTPENPDLPTQANPATSLFDHVTALDKVENDVDASRTPAQVQKAVGDLRRIRETLGLPDLDDSQLQRVMQKIIAKQEGGNPVKKAIKAEAAKTKRLVQAQQERQQSIDSAQNWYAEEEAKLPEDRAPWLGEYTKYIGDLSKRGSRGSQLVASGQIHKLAQDLAGDPDMMERLKSQVEQILQTGKGLVKIRPANEEIHSAIKDNPDSEPTKNIVLESALQAIQNKNAERAWNAWDSPEKANTSFEHDKEIFADWANEFGPPEASDLSDAAEYFAERYSRPLASRDEAVSQPVSEWKDELKDFLTRPHVKVWLDTLNDGLVEKRVNAPQVTQPRIPAGGGFVWGLGDYNPATNRLNNKHTLPKSSELTEAQFTSMAGRGKPMNKIEVDLLKALVPEAFDEKGNVNVRKLYDLLPGREPQVEVRKLTEGGDLSRIDQLRHEFDSMSNVQYDGDSARIEGEARPETRAMVEEYNRLVNQQGTSAEARSRYSFLGPKSESEMPGYVEGLVRVPIDKANKKRQPFAEEEDAGITGPQPTKQASYSGPHFGSEDKNVLAFFRGYEETLPNGKKAFHVIEVQSDWGQARKKQEDAERKSNAGQLLTTAEYRSQDTADHPLLSAYETLALKAAIDHARSIGADSIILSDGETAMMTEGHDKAAKPTFANEENAAKAKALLETKPDQSKFYLEDLRQIAEGREPNTTDWGREGLIKAGLVPDQEVSQSAGMRLHYDTTLPSAMKKLTGEEGQRVEVGTHEKAKRPTSIDPEMDGIAGADLAKMGQVEGSPVFRNPNGSPKSSISARLYPLSKAFANSDEQGGFTLGDPARAPQYKLPETWKPDNEEDVKSAMELTGTGTTLAKQLIASSDPELSALAKDLVKNFPEALERIKSGVFDVSGSAAFRRANHEVQITFDPSVPSMWTGAKENLLMHELLHGLTLHELANPRVDAQVVQDLTNLRQRLVERLNPETRAAYDRAIASDWYKRYGQGNATYQELHPDGNTRQLLYGLLNNDELVSQAFTSNVMRQFMRDTQSQGRKSAWSAFTGYVKKLLGLGETVKGTAFDEFMGLTSQLMNQGEFLSSFSNFGERYFEGQGKGGSYGKQQTQRALGLAADSALWGTSRDILGVRLDLFNKVSKANPELVQARKAWDLATAMKGEDYTQTKAVLDELGHKDLDALTTDAITEDSNISSAVDLLPDVATKYLFAKLRDSKDMLDVLRAATVAKNKGIVNIAKPEFVRGPVTETLKAVNKLLENQQRLEGHAQMLAGLSAVDPSGFLDAAPRMAPKDAEEVFDEPKGVGGKALSWLGNFLEPMGQLARRIPEASEMLSKGFQLGPNSRKMFSSAMKVFGMDTSAPEMDLLSHESVQQSTKVFSNPKLLAAANKWIWWNQKKGGDSVQQLPESDADVAKELRGLSPQERSDVAALVAKQGKSTQMMNAQKLEKMQQIAALNGAAIIQADTGAKVADNLALSDTLLKAIMDSGDPLKQPQVDAAIRNVQQRMQPEAFLNLLRYSQNAAETIGNWKQYYDANPFWATAQRTERYLIKGTKSGKPVTLQASSIKEAKDIVEKKGITLTEPFVDNWTGKEDEPFQVPNMSPEMARRMQELEQNQMEMLGKVLPPEALAEIQRTSAVKQIMREATATQQLPGVQAPPRLLSQGADELPWMWNHITWAQRESSYWSRQLLRAQARTYLNGPEVAANPELQTKLQTHVENLLHPDPQLAQKMTRLASTWFLGYNLATSIINSAQPFTTHVGELTAISGKPLDSYKRVLNALSEIGGHFAGRKDWASPEHEKLMQDAVHDGEIGIGKYDEEAAAQESIAENYKRAMMKEKPQDVGQRLSTAAGIYSNVGMKLFQVGEQVNSRAAVLAAFDLYREQGLSYDEAKQKAYEFNHAVNYSGGRAQRPVGAYSGRGAFPRSLAMLGTSLQSYVLGTTFQLARYLQQGFLRPSGVTPAQTFAARRAFVQMLGTQFAAAGLLGLPFVSSAMALLNKLFPDAELNRRVREGINNFLSSDKENGSTLTDVAMTGIPSMLGWDLQSRLSMGNTLPGVSEVNGFQPENLLGPPANIVKNFVEGTQGLASGQPGAGLKFLPPAIAKMIQAGQSWLGDQGNLRDYAGRPLANPTPGERLGTVLGFQPLRLSQQNAAGRILKQSEDVIARDTSQFHQQQAQQVLAGNFGSVRQALLQRSQNNTDYNPVEGARAISRAAEELQFPRDLRAEGSRQGSNARASLLASYSGVNPNATSELDKLNFRTMIQQKLGVAPADLNSAVVQATLMDRLKLSHPEWTRVQLRAAAADLSRRSSRGAPQLQEVDQ